jgi:adenosylhomocysteine nucleosidase
MITGIMGAMPEEIQALLHQMKLTETTVIGQRQYHRGMLFEQEVVLVFSRWGKVAAASTTATLLERFGVNRLIFTGVAGSLNEKVRIGDVVLARRLCQHDLDARPFMPKHEVPLLGCKWFSTNPDFLQEAEANLKPLFGENGILKRDYREQLQQHNINCPALHLAEIGSGDQVISRPEQKAAILEHLPDISCVEMEGAAVAQVCFEYGVPFLVMRTISDTANEHTVTDFPRFIGEVAGRYALCMIQRLLGVH